MKFSHLHLSWLAALALFASCYRADEKYEPYSQICGPEAGIFTDTWTGGWCVGGPRLDSNDMFILEGFGHDTVLLFVQGGPNVEIDASRINYYEQHMDVAYLIQGQMLQGFRQVDSIVNDAWPQANVDISNSAMMLNELLRYFKDKGKTVVLFGESWGCFVIQQWLSEYHNIADKIVLSVGRLQAAGMLNNTFYPAYTAETIAYLREQSNKDYTALLDDKDMSNVIYIYGEFDTTTFPLTQEEIDWLSEKNVPTYKMKSTHFAAIDPAATLIIMDWIFRN